MFHKYFNPVKKLFAFRFAFLAEVSVTGMFSLRHSLVPINQMPSHPTLSHSAGPRFLSIVIRKSDET